MGQIVYSYSYYFQYFAFIKTFVVKYYHANRVPKNSHILHLLVNIKKYFISSL